MAVGSKNSKEKVYTDTVKAAMLGALLSKIAWGEYRLATVGMKKRFGRLFGSI